jgi:hypothetical protein
VRDPSIHIKESDLIRLIKDKDLAQSIVKKAKSLSVSSRSVYANNNKLEKKVEKLKLASRSDAGKFAQALLLIRRKFKHRGLQLIGPTDTEWLILKDICVGATEFCNEFGFKLELGYREYITIAMGMMKNFSLNKFKSLHGPICNIFEAQSEIQRDKSPERTSKAHDFYVATIHEKIGFAKGYDTVPEKFVYFIRMVGLADSMGIDTRTYIKAQFAGMDWRGGIPDPMQLVGDKALQRVQQYCFEHNIKLGKQSQGIDYSKIKGIGKNNRK